MKTCPRCDGRYTDDEGVCTTDGCGARLIPSRELEVGAVIRGKYRIQSLLGMGGFGAVYLAEHMDLKELRALKFLSIERMQDKKGFERFRAEAQAARKLRHPNVAEVYDLDWSEDGSPFIAMEYINGPELQKEIPAAGMVVERALAIAHGLASGLSAAHARGIVHRDVKPNNILLAQARQPDESPKLLDFGIAAMQDSSPGRSMTRGWLLTPEYASPEQWNFMPAEQMDGRVDLYALGGVLYEMLTGSPCVHHHGAESAMRFHLSGQRTPPSSVRAELNRWPGLDDLVLRLLSADRDLRPRNAEVFLQQLELVRHRSVSPISIRSQTLLEQRRVTLAEDLLTTEAGLASGQGSQSDRGNRASGQNWKWIALAGLGMVVLSVAAGLYFLRDKSAAKDRTASVTAKLRENPKDGLEYTWIPAGTFTMGCSPGDAECQPDEKPAHPVTISKGFWMGTTLVTVAGWERYSAAVNAPPLPSTDSAGRSELNQAGAGNMPVVLVPFEKAESYCRWSGGQLPTEAQWEYAARAGEAGSRYGDIEQIAWYANNSGRKPLNASAVLRSYGGNAEEYESALKLNGNFAHPVSLKQPNRWGLYDTLGNVYQWTSDWYDANSYQNGPQTDPEGPSVGQKRAARGGGWDQLASSIRLSSRDGFNPRLGFTAVGFRCVMKD